LDFDLADKDGTPGEHGSEKCQQKSETS